MTAGPDCKNMPGGRRVHSGRTLVPKASGDAVFGKAASAESASAAGYWNDRKGRNQHQPGPS